MYRLFNNSLGVPIGTPFEDNRKCGADLFGFGSVLGSFIDTAVSSSDRRAANELNYFANQETNAANERMNQEQLAAARENWAREQANFEKQRQWSLQDRDFENQYNSPKALMQRYREAGLNPYLMMDGQISQASASGSTGQAPQFGSPPSNIPAQAAHFEPTMPYGLGIGKGLSDAMNLYLSERENERADYALASDITFRDRDSQIKYLEARTKAREAGIHESALEQSDRHFNATMAFEKDKFARQKEVDDLNYDLGVKSLEIEKEKVRIDEMLAKSKIKVDNATISKLAAETQSIKDTVEEMKRNGASQRKIDEFIRDKEANLVEILERENNRGRRTDKGVLKYYKDIAGALLDPLKGLVSVGVK